MIFKKRKLILDNEAVAESLKNRRIEKGMDLENISKEINISVKYLQALERGRFDLLPRGVYGKNFLKEYSLFLGIDCKDFLEVFDEEMKFEKEQNRERLFARKVTREQYFLIIPRIIKNFFIILFVAICIVYLGFYVRNIVSPPELTLIDPVNDIVISEYLIEIYGKTDNEAEVKINREIVLLDQFGYFKKEINLKSGINNIEISSKKKYSKENIIYRKVLVR